MSAPLVEMKNVSIAFGGVQAVDDVSITLYPGEVVGLLRGADILKWLTLHGGEHQLAG